MVVESGFGNEDNHNALQLFVWRVFIPLMKMVRAYDLDVLNKVESSSSSSSCWSNLLELIVFFLLLFVLY